MLTLLSMVLAATGVLAAGLSLYLLSLSLLAFASAAESAAGPPSARLAVLVPAHDEAGQIASCVRSLLSQAYPRGLYEVVVVADNCGDDTAAVAARAGARVMVREDRSALGKGHALRWAMDRLLAEPDPPDAIVVVDADTSADPAFLATLVRPFERGAAAVQGESLLAEDGTTATALRVAAFLLFNRVRPAGRAAMGRSGFLAGNGMLLSRPLLEARPWHAYTSAEDVEYSLALHVAGVHVAFARGAVLVSPSAPNARAAAEQQLRWEGGKSHLARTWVPRLLAVAVREVRPELLGTALDLAVPPLGFLAAGVACGTVVAAAAAALGVLPAWPVAPWLVAAVAIPALVLAGLLAGRAPAGAYRAMARAPLFVAAKALRAGKVLRFRGDTWVRTERAGESPR